MNLKGGELAETPGSVGGGNGIASLCAFRVGVNLLYIWDKLEGGRMDDRSFCSAASGLVWRRASRPGVLVQDARVKLLIEH